MSNSSANNYREMAIKTANRGQLLVMLYEAAIRNVKKASIALDKKDIAAKGAAISKAHDIVNELLNTLNFEAGGDIARELERLYNFIIEHLIAANLENSKEKLKAIEKILETLLGAWKIAVENMNQQKK